MLQTIREFYDRYKWSLIAIKLQVNYTNSWTLINLEILPKLISDSVDELQNEETTPLTIEKDLDYI